MDNSKTLQPFHSYSCHIVVSIALLPAQKAVDQEIGSQTLSDTLTSGTTLLRKRNTQDLFLRRFLHESFIMGKKSKGGKTDPKAVKQAAKPSQKEKDRQSKEEKAAQRLAIRKEKNLQCCSVSNSATMTETALMEEPMETVQGASQARQAAARAQMTGFYQE
jgi:hypothetical protein